MAKISHTKIKQPSFGEKRPKLTYTKISRFTVHLITTMSMSDYGVKIGIEADTGIMLLKPSTVSAVVNVVGS